MQAMLSMLAFLGTSLTFECRKLSDYKSGTCMIKHRGLELMCIERVCLKQAVLSMGEMQQSGTDKDQLLLSIVKTKS